MLKYLLLIGLVAVIWWKWRKRSRSAAETPRPQAPAERMVACARCGLNLPLSESLAADGRFYCCEAHRRMDEDKPSP